MSGETEQNVSAWTIDSLRYHLEQIATDLDKRYEQRFQAQEKAIDAATATETKLLDERFMAQEKAIAAALLAHDRMVAMLRETVEARFLASEKSVSIASAAQEKRFDSVNEFRAQLNDQANTFMPRTEYTSAHSALIEKVDSGTGRLAERIAALELRINSIASTTIGATEQRNALRLNLGAVVGLAGFILTVMIVATTVILSLNN